MRTLVVFSHPCQESFNFAVLQSVVETLMAKGHDVRVRDLYQEGFNPVMYADERRRYHDEGVNIAPVAEYVDDIAWSEMLVFVYPTWWYGLPAMLKGWFDRVWLPHVAFSMPTNEIGSRPMMQHIRAIAVVTTCGASWWLSKLIGEPGRKTILRGLRALCAPRCRTLYMALYKMDTSTAESRTRYLADIRRKLSAFAG